jgi:hypothetical protein
MLQFDMRTIGIAGLSALALLAVACGGATVAHVIPTMTAPATGVDRTSTPAIVLPTLVIEPTRVSKAIQHSTDTNGALCQGNAGMCDMSKYCLSWPGGGTCAPAIKSLIDNINSVVNHSGDFYALDNMLCGDARSWHVEQVGPGDNDFACFAGIDPREDSAARIPTPLPTRWPTPSPSQIASIAATEAAGHAGCTSAEAKTPTSRCSGDD